MSPQRAVPFSISSAFTNSPFGGNPAAVVFLDSEADAKLDADTLGKIAVNFQQPMTAFVYTSTKSEASAAAGTATFEIRWITPTATEVSICGHATLVAASAIFARGLVGAEITTLEFRGRMNGSIIRASKRPNGKFEISLPRSNTFSEKIPAGDALLPMLRQFESPDIVFVGHGGPGFENYLLIELDLKGNKTLGEYEVDAEAFRSTGYLVNIVTTRSPTPDASFVSRMFSPIALPADHAEDQVCGSAHCLLAPYWQNKLGLGQEFSARQVSTRGGDLGLRLDDNMVALEGETAVIANGEIFL
uniref:Diaminopimelate epimerase-like protein n=1 Tax=Mycena chlorophos TaxID=658473 RepID=A0ABQ0L8Z0_MYCCL|nr:predicted protein [Mycena chlorophos]